MAQMHAASSELAGLAQKLANRMGDLSLCGRTLRLVSNHAPDERLALTAILSLAEASAEELVRVLSDPEAARALVFCVGSSEIVANELAAAGPGFSRVLADARALTLDALDATMRFELSEVSDRTSAP